jgi:hypothetical protein
MVLFIIIGKINKKKLQPNKLSINDENKDIHMEIYMDMKKYIKCWKIPYYQ